MIQGANAQRELATSFHSSSTVYFLVLLDNLSPRQYLASMPLDYSEIKYDYLV